MCVGILTSVPYRVVYSKGTDVSTNTHFIPLAWEYPYRWVQLESYYSFVAAFID